MSLKSHPPRSPGSSSLLLRAVLGAALALPLMVPASASATPDAGLADHQAALETLRSDIHAKAVTAELASYDAWLRAAATHAEYGQTDALRRVRGRLDAQRALIEARLDAARGESRTDAARDRLRALDRQIKQARSDRALLERHLERTQKRGQ